MFGIGYVEMIILGVICIVIPLVVIGLVFVVTLMNRKESATQHPNLIPCPDCDRQISPSTVSCPHCGRPIHG